MTKMPLMTMPEFGDVVLVAFPFTDLQTLKRRPAVVVSSANFNDQGRDVILMAVTSNLHQPAMFGDLTINDWEIAGLLKPSMLKPLLATLHVSLVRATLGRLATADSLGLQRTLSSILGPTARR